MKRDWEELAATSYVDTVAKLQTTLAEHDTTLTALSGQEVFEDDYSMLNNN